MTAYASSCIIFSDLLCVFGCVYPLHSGHESHFVVFLVAFCRRQGLYQSVVKQSASCLGAGLVLTMLMTSLLLNCEALWFYLWEIEQTLFSCLKYIFFRKIFFLLNFNKSQFFSLRLRVIFRSFDGNFDDKAVKEILRETWLRFQKCQSNGTLLFFAL